MRKFLKLIWVVLCYTYMLNVNGQTVVDTIFEHVSRDKITTGLFRPYGMQYINPQLYNGIISDGVFCDIYTWEKLYAGMANSIFTESANIEPLASVVERFKQFRTEESTPIPIAEMFIAYEDIKPDAASKGLIDIVNS